MSGLPPESPGRPTTRAELEEVSFHFWFLIFCILSIIFVFFFFICRSIQRDGKCEQQLILYMLILCFPHENASAQTLLAHSSSNQGKIWLFRKWWNFHISEFFQNLILLLNHTSRYPSQYPTHWFAMVSLRMGVNIEIQKHPQRSKAPLK